MRYRLGGAKKIVKKNHTLILQFCKKKLYTLTLFVKENIFKSPSLYILPILLQHKTISYSMEEELERQKTELCAKPQYRTSGLIYTGCIGLYRIILHAHICTCTYTCTCIIALRTKERISISLQNFNLLLNRKTTSFWPVFLVWIIHIINSSVRESFNTMLVVPKIRVAPSVYTIPPLYQCPSISFYENVINNKSFFKVLKDIPGF